MSQSLFLFIGINALLGALVCFLFLRWFAAYRELKSLTRKNAVLSLKKKNGIGGPFIAKELLNGSRSRDIAIIVPSKKEDVIETITEFTETMRENGSFIYHFTNYWGVTDQKKTQRIVTEAMSHEYHGIFTLGTNLTKLAKSNSVTRNKNTPIVFTHVQEEMWQKEQEKKPVSHITGVTLFDNWRYRIKMYLYIKPFMRSVLVPVTHPSMHDSVAMIVDILQSYGINARPVTIHGCSELIRTLSHYVDEVDSVILARDELSTETCSKVAKQCSDSGITLFSPYLKDVHLGAAVAMNTIQERFGFFAAEKMLSILEGNQSPASIPTLSIGRREPYEVHFNQAAMQAQGLDSERITTLTLQYGKKLYTTLEKDIE